MRYRNGSWTINGVGFADARNRILAKPERGNVELWQFENKSGIWSHRMYPQRHAKLAKLPGVNGSRLTRKKKRNLSRSYPPCRL